MIIQCLSCNAKFKVLDSIKGQKVKCAKCGNVINANQKEVKNSKPIRKIEKSETIKVLCPGCNAKYLMSKKIRGKKIKCAKCQGVIVVDECEIIDSNINAPKIIDPIKNPQKESKPDSIRFVIEGQDENEIK